MLKYTRRVFHKRGLTILASLIGASAFSIGSYSSANKSIPVILDTDIGDDIDDTWALMMLLRTQPFNTKLITTDFGNTRYRTRLLAKLLDSMGCGNVPLGIGLDASDKSGNQSDWLGDYRLEDYPGQIYEDGIQALIDTIKKSPEPVTLLCIGPVTNIAEALRREPSIAKNARFVGMHGSIRTGYDGEAKAAAEWNVKVDPKALQTVFLAPWECAITPLDTCGLVQLEGESYQKVFQSSDGWMEVLMENYRVWLPKVTWLDPKPDFRIMSSTLFDTVAVHLAQSEEFLVMEDLPLRVTDDGYTVIDEKRGRIVRCATAWKNQSAFEDKLIEVLKGDG